MRRRSLVLMWLLACDGPSAAIEPEPAAAVEVVTPAPPVPVQPSSIGWWRSDVLCLELFHNGDFEISVLDADPKILIYGAAKLMPAADATVQVELTVAKLWRGRYISNCRKHHELGRFTDSEHALGVEFVPAAVRVLTLRHTGEDTVELCGERCQSLKREAPTLGGRWHVAGYERSDFIQPAGELMALNLQSELVSMQIGDGATRGQSAYGKVTTTSLGEDRFAVAFTPDMLALDEAPTLYGVKIAVGVPRRLTARRLAGQRLEVCEGERCVTLERSLDAYNYGVR